jgi:hypothetical protein
MIKSLTIELAFKRLVAKPKVMPRPPKRNEPGYDVYELHYDMDDCLAIPGFHTPTSFMKKLNIDKEKKEMLQIVNYLLTKFLTKEPFINMTYVISDSYGYFCFTDEKDKMIFATPHITSPVLFNPNEEESLYKLGYCGVLVYNRARKERESLLKHIDEHVLRVENTFNTGNYSVQQIINSLIDYRKNKATSTSLITELGSIYEDVLPGTMPNIVSASTYEFRAFNYTGPDDDIQF